MPKFHFEIRNGHTIEDPQGFELATKEEAEKLAEDIARQIAIDVGDTTSRKVIVSTDKGEKLYEVPIKVAVG